MRHIALVCDWYAPRRGGIETHLDGLATRLMARGDEVHVITSTPGDAIVNGVRVHRLDVPRLPLAGVAFAPVASKIGRLLDRERVDVVHSHVSIVSPVALAGGLAAARAHRPSVLTFHSFVPFTPILAGVTGGLLGAARWPAVMTAVSGRVAREVATFARDASFTLLPNAIDTTFWRPAESPGDRRAVRLIYAGRLQSKKRPRLLLGVLRELRRHSFTLTIVGAGPLEADLRRGVRALGLEAQVDFTGWLQPDRLREALRASDVFLSTAMRESFGIAALEARAVGVPVIAMRDSAVADFIDHERSGLLAGDDDAFIRETVRLVEDEGLRGRIARHNRETTVPFDWDHTLALHDAAYDRATALVR